MSTVNRRSLLALGAAAPAALSMNLAPGKATASDTKGLPRAYTLPDLPYPADALEPHLDKETLTIHQGKHHAGYVKGLNKTIEALEKAHKQNDYGKVQALSRALAFHGAGHVLHGLYFANLSPKPDKPWGAFEKAVKGQYGDMKTLEKHFIAATSSVAGSGWGLLCYEPAGGRLLVLQAEKHENQLIPGAAPLLVIDVWEHAYYLKYQNKRGDYLKAIMNVVDWGEVSRRFDLARQ